MRFIDKLSPGFVAVLVLLLLFALVMGTLWSALQSWS